jgi:ssDNA-binding Zn-finger/Zn-ribbon topoisomerase 1
MSDIELFLSDLMGDFEKQISPIENSNTYSFNYVKPLFNYPTIQMVIKSPLVYDKYIDRYILAENSFFLFFLYDLETDMIIGELEEIYFDENWQDELYFSICDAENRVQKYICPECEFWLVQRTNMYGHKFLGCCGYPECNFSSEIKELEN